MREQVEERKWRTRHDTCLLRMPVVDGADDVSLYLPSLLLFFVLNTYETPMGRA